VRKARHQAGFFIGASGRLCFLVIAHLKALFSEQLPVESSLISSAPQAQSSVVHRLKGRTL
jgi:hypothetical protein